MSDVFIVGADMIKFGRYPDRYPAQLGAEAALMALDDAGLTVKDVDVVYTGSTFTAQSSLGQKVLKEIGQTGIPCINVSNACASGATAVREAFVASKAASTMWRSRSAWKKTRWECWHRRRRKACPRKACSARTRCRPCSPNAVWCIARNTARRWNSSPRWR